MPLSADQGCTHCGLPVPPDAEPHRGGPRFCCPGCRGAHALIHQLGLGAYYEQRDAGSTAPATSPSAPRPHYGDFDRPSFIDANSRACAEGQREITLGIDGLRCAACLWLLEKLPTILPGVAEARVDWRRETLRVRWQTEAIALSTIAETVAELGYPPRAAVAEPETDRHQARARRQLVDLGVAFAAAGNNMLISLSLYLGMFSSMSPTVTDLLRWASLALGSVSLLGPGRTFFVGALAALRTRTPHMDLPIALGLLAGGVAGLVNTVRGRGEIYFDTISALVFLLLLGRWIQVRQQRKAADAVEVLRRLTPRNTRRVVDGELVMVPSSVLEAGDEVEVWAGELVPADGVIVRGRSSLDEKLLTGESRPVSVEPGSRVAAGCSNLAAPLRVRVEAAGDDTRMGRLLSKVERVDGAPPRIVQLADRMGGWFVLVVMAAAAATFVGWLTVAPELAVDHAVALLIVACPCALALATPLAVSVGLGRAARRQILIKGGDVLQALATPGTLWLDKTGTLTRGTMSVMAWEGDREIAGWVAALERGSTHPVARALVTHGEHELSCEEASVTDVRQSARGGIVGRVNGRSLVVGNAPFVERTLGKTIAPPMMAAAVRLLERATAPTFIALDGRVVAVAGLGDPLRDDALVEVTRLRDKGWRVGILSGDHPDIVAHAGKMLGLEEHMCHGGLTPEDKVEYIRDPSVARPVVMVGEGINDSAALAAATVGIAVHDGAEASLEAAPVYLGTPGLSGIRELLHESRATMRTIRRNFAVSLFYNGLTVSLAALGLVSPLLAAILMPISSLSVVGSSLSSSRRSPVS